MSDLLQTIVARRRKSLASERAALPEAAFYDQLTKSDRDFEAALRNARPAFILEYKKASPSKGTIRPAGDLATVCAAYQAHASAISVLTEPEFFTGSFDDLERVRAQVDLPVLCKDFIVEPYQVLRARWHGADAILLILAILDDATYRGLAQLAANWGMAVLTEIANREEQQRAIRLGARIVGINNRDLRDFSIDLRRTAQLADGLRDEQLVISESGYATRADLQPVLPHAQGFLVGSALMAEACISRAVKRLVFGDHKVCGLTRSTDAQAADALGAVYGGVILADASPRRVDPGRIPEIFRETALLRVAVVQNQASKDIVRWAEEFELAAVQLHGVESPGEVRALRSDLPGDVEIWRALSVEELRETFTEWTQAGAVRFVVDNAVGSQRGGTGVAFDWSRLPAGGRDKIMLAGGIGPDNIRRAMELGVAGLDLNSGVEAAPGLKSADKLRDVFHQIRTYR